MKNFIEWIINKREASRIAENRKRFDTEDHKKIVAFFDWMKSPEGLEALLKAPPTGIVLEISNSALSTGYSSPLREIEENLK